MYVIMRHDDYLQENNTFAREIENVQIFTREGLVYRIAKRLNADVISIRKLIREKVWTLDKSCKFQFQRALNRAVETVSKWPEWKQNCLDNSPTVKVPRTPVLNEDCY